MTGNRKIVDDVASDLTTDKYDAAIVIATDGDATDVGGDISRSVDNPHVLSLWLVATHLWHVSESAQNAGGTATPEDVANDAIAMLSEAGEPHD